MGQIDASTFFKQYRSMINMARLTYASRNLDALNILKIESLTFYK